MKNPATHATKDDFNVFTLFLKEEIAAGRVPVVKLRNGLSVEIRWFTEDGPEYEHFIFRDASRGVYMIWENDGHSVTRSDDDMMEFLVSIEDKNDEAQ